MTGAEMAQLQRALASARARRNWHEAEALEDQLFDARRSEVRFKHVGPSTKVRGVASEEAAMLAVVAHRRECHDNATHKGCSWPGVTFSEEVADADGQVSMRRRKMGGPCSPAVCRLCKDASGVPWHSDREKRRLERAADEGLRKGAFDRRVLSALERAELRNDLLTLARLLAALAGSLP